ncbi:MAG: DUF4012 domain-containing protein, partial [Candidatus Paceibacterota bacterium]
LRPFTYIILDDIRAAELHPWDAKSGQKILIITYSGRAFKQMRSRLEDFAHTSVKLAHLSKDEESSDVIDKLMWFLFSRDSEKAIDFVSPLPRTRSPSSKQHRSWPQLTRKRIVGIILAGFFAIEFFFVLPLIGSTAHLVKAVRFLKAENVQLATHSLEKGKPWLSLAKTSYSFSRPILSFFFLALPADNMFTLQEQGYELGHASINASAHAREFSKLFLQQNKSESDVRRARTLLTQLTDDLERLSSATGILVDKLDFSFEATRQLRSNIRTASELLSNLERLAPYLDELVGGKGERKYVVFFYNNMELRPGGGFIGSFATLSVDSYTLKELTVYDVYDADGQLKTHVEPPQAIKQHLRQPHWYLRDSNFSPDFVENVTSAEFFLGRELEFSSFDGAIGITTTGLSLLLDGFGELYIPDFDTTITKDNFYLTTQNYVEEAFFPGSKRKKNFLSSVARMMILKSESLSYQAFGIGLKRALDEKHLMFSSRSDKIQKTIQSLGWSGTLLTPRCVTPTARCVVNHIFPIDANLGVNKANYFVERLIKLTQNIDKSGLITNRLTTTFTNSSQSNAFPGGPYKNYFQVYLPSASKVSSITVHGQKISSFDEYNTGAFKIVGFLVTVPPGETITTEISYTLDDKISDGQSAYQIIVQKQIGLQNTDFALEINLPENIIVIDQNFSDLAKGQNIIYNTSLSQDQIFLLELNKIK